MRWLRRLEWGISAIAQVIATIATAAMQTLRQRHHRDDEPQPPRQEHTSTPASGATTPSTGIEVEGTTIHLPAPSIWPAVVALGTACMLFGIVTSLGYSVAGVLVLAIGLGGWIGELHRE